MKVWSFHESRHLAAIARFPDWRHAIEALAGADENFRSLCDGLAEV
jgi:hypothetical protein